MNRITYIRNAEKEYHDYCYDNYKLFEKGSWLYKPVQTVMEHLKKARLGQKQSARHLLRNIQN